jgi:uncharacterized GH25 family protein
MRSLIALATLAWLSTAVNAHFVFVYVPDGATEVRVVFGHTATPDPKTFPTRAEKTTLTARDAEGKDAKLTLEKVDGNYFRGKFTGKPVVVFGTTEAGVVQRGDAEPVLAWYYAKVIVGDPFTKVAGAGKGIPLDIVPVREGKTVRFLVLSDGKPAEGIDVTVVVPGGDEGGQAVKSDKDGMTTGFADTGRYCVAARRTEEKPGEAGGKKYTAVRHTATLVCDITGPSK